VRLRARLAKLDRARFLSHRDLQRTLDRALRRSGLPVAYSQGFTPHPRISYGPALATGYSSEAEFFDLELASPVDPDGFRDRLNGSLPAGLQILEAREVALQGPKVGARIAAAEYLLTLSGLTAAGSLAEAAELRDPRVYSLRVEAPATVRAVLQCSDGGGIRPEDLLAGMKQAAPWLGAALLATVHRAMLYSLDPETGRLIPPW
jgi:hypothetical protein